MQKKLDLKEFKQFIDEIIFEEKDLFLDIEDETVRNYNRAVLLRNLMEDRCRLDFDDAELVLSVKTRLSPACIILSASYLKNFSKEDIENVSELLRRLLSNG